MDFDSEMEEPGARTRALLWAIPTISTIFIFALILYGVSLNEQTITGKNGDDSGHPLVVQMDNIFIAETKLATTTAIIKDISYTLEVAHTRNARIQGLSGREHLASQQGMLFIFPENGYHGIWMKDMHFPIDIIWLSADWVVVDTARNISPESYKDHTTFTPSQEARYVIELPAGSI
ncbi:MAG: DUF192 domain-containing protein [Patescibacteria group bacterium]